MKKRLYPFLAFLAIMILAFLSVAADHAVAATQTPTPTPTCGSYTITPITAYSSVNVRSEPFIPVNKLVDNVLYTLKRGDSIPTVELLKKGTTFGGIKLDQDWWHTSPVSSFVAASVVTATCSAVPPSPTRLPTTPTPTATRTVTPTQTPASQTILHLVYNGTDVVCGQTCTFFVYPFIGTSTPTPTLITP